MTGAEDEHTYLTEEQRAARRSNRRTLVIILIFIVVLGLIPLVVVLGGKLS